MAKRGTFLYRDYVDLLDGDILSALVLSQLVYWCLPTDHGKAKLRAFKDGMWWVSKSHQEWETELGMSRMQSRRCLEVLKAKGLIITERFCFNGAPTVHVRLGVSAGGQVLKDVPSVQELQENIGYQQPMETGTIGYEQPKHWLPGTNPLVAGNQTITETTTEITTETTEEKNSVQKPHAKPAGPGNRKNQQEEKSEGAKTDMTVQEVLAKKAGQGPASLAGFWQHRMALMTDEVQKPLTVKEQSQLKGLAKALATVPGLETRQVVSYILDRWVTFGSKVQQSAGLLNFPSDPHPGFLMKYWPVAAKMWLQSIARAESAAKISTTVVKTTTQVEFPVTTPVKQVYKVPQAEIDAWFAEAEEMSK